MKEQSKGTKPDIDKLEEEIFLLELGAISLCEYAAKSSKEDDLKITLKYIQKAATLIFEKEEQLAKLRAETDGKRDDRL